MWLNLDGAELPDVGHRLRPHACLSVFGSCCLEWLNVTVLNCRDFLLYFLSASLYYDSAYCATIDN